MREHNGEEWDKFEIIIFKEGWINSLLSRQCVKPSKCKKGEFWRVFLNEGNLFFRFMCLATEEVLTKEGGGLKTYGDA